jgi:hypothetical protein
LLKPQEYGDLISRYGEKRVEEYIKLFSAHKISTGKSYVSNYGTLLKWLLRDHGKQEPRIDLKCLSCGRELRDEYEKCPKCGENLTKSIGDEVPFKPP